MKTTVFVTFCLAFFAMGILAQTDNTARVDGFLGLILDQTTAIEAAKILGQEPAKEKIEALEVSDLGKWLVTKRKEKIFRQLTFNKIGDFRTIELSFLDDKLVMIDLKFSKTYKPSHLKGIFGLPFIALGGPVSLPNQPDDKPKGFFISMTYPAYFKSYGVSERLFAIANCMSSSIGIPERIDRTRLISRSLEKK